MFGVSWRIVAPLTSPAGLLIWVSQPENLWRSLAAISVLITILASIMLIFAQ